MTLDPSPYDQKKEVPSSSANATTESHPRVQSRGKNMATLMSEIQPNTTKIGPGGWNIHGSNLEFRISKFEFRISSALLQMVDDSPANGKLGDPE